MKASFNICQGTDTACRKVDIIKTSPKVTVFVYEFYFVSTS